VALVHALARHHAESEPANGMPAEILDEASFRAAREGVHATLPDDDGRLRPVSELVEETLALVRPAARELGCAPQLDGVTALLADGGGAGVQRAACRDGDVATVLEALLASR
jgi:gamma-glutamyl:cysteine ligase YbdK (ATP-grasp superfamily)